MVGPTAPDVPIPKTVQGYELCLGVNCVATHLLTRLLTPTLIATGGLSRIVWYSSFGMEIGAEPDVAISLGNLDYHTWQKETKRYIVSKTGAWALGIEHNRHYKAQGVASVPIDPGNIVSGLPRDQSLQLRIVAKLVCYPTVNGAYTALYAAFSPETVSDQADWTKEWGKFEASTTIREEILKLMFFVPQSLHLDACSLSVLTFPRLRFSRRMAGTEAPLSSGIGARNRSKSIFRSTASMTEVRVD